jgi:hypothetical protein
VVDTAAPPVPVRERGYAVQQATATASWWTDFDVEQTPELRWPACIPVYNAMRRQDAQVSSVLRAVTAPIVRTPWRVDGTGCDPKVTSLIAGDLGLPVVGAGNDVPALRTRDRFSWQDHLRQALLMLVFGHSFFEQVYRIDEAGMARLRKLGYRPPQTITAINVARDGGLVSIEQGYGADITGSSTVKLPIGRLVAYVLEREGGDWTGTSLLRPAYKNWLLKDRLLRVQTQSVERNGMGIPVYKGATGESAELDAGQDIAAGIRAGDNTGASLPNGADLVLMGVTGSLPDADKPIRYHDEQIARAVLAHFLNLGSQTGSWALGSTFADFFTLSLQAVATQVSTTSTAHVIEDLVDINFGPTEPAPRIVFDEIGSRGDAVVGAISTLVGAGVLKPDEDLEQFIRTALGLPARGGAPLQPAQEASA